MVLVEDGLAVGGVNLLDDVEVHSPPLVGEHLVALHVLEQRQVAASDRCGETRIELAGDAHLVGEGDDVCHPLHLPDLDGGDVARHDQGAPGGHAAHGPVVEVHRPVAVEVSRRVVEHRRERDLVISQRGFVHVRLERGPRLT